MTIDENKFAASVRSWGEQFKFLSPEKCIELLKESEVKMENVICPCCRQIHVSKAKTCPFCGYERILDGRKKVEDPR